MKTERLISLLKKSTILQLKHSPGTRVFIRGKLGDVTVSTVLRQEAFSVVTHAGVIPEDRVFHTKAEAELGLHFVPAYDVKAGQVVAVVRPTLDIGIVVDAERTIVNHFTTASSGLQLFQLDLSECFACIKHGDVHIATPFDTIKTKVKYPQSSSPTQESFLIAVALKFGAAKQGIAYLQKVALWE